MALPKTEKNCETLAEQIYEAVCSPNQLNKELLHRLCITYVNGLSDDAFRDYWYHYVGAPNDD
jgi:hypothetical protein